MKPRKYDQNTAAEDYPRLAEMDKTTVWHPFTQMADYNQASPLIIAAGRGSYLIDVQGRKYLDGVSSLWVNVHGHQHPEITAAIIAQVQKIAHSTLLGLSNVPAIELAQRLVEISPSGLNKVFYSECGSAAVEIGLKMAFQYWQQRSDPRPGKTRFLYLQNAYHGDTLGAVGVGGIDLFHQIYHPVIVDHICAPAPYCYRCFLSQTYPECKLACVKGFEQVVSRHHDEIAACIIEPLVQGAAGMITHPPGYLKQIREITAQYDILLIADEVAVGFGRTGRMFACEQEDVSPDILTVGKGITGGYLPLAATLTTDQIYEAFLGEYQEFRTFFHGHTYTGNPVTCAAALANLDTFEKEKTLENLQKKITALGEFLERFKDLPHVGEVRQKGFMVGIELVRDRKSKEPYPYEDKIGIRVIEETRKNGLILRPLGNVIVLMPPLSITREELRQLTDITWNAIKKVTEG